jgi:hypothetical protein
VNPLAQIGCERKVIAPRTIDLWNSITARSEWRTASSPTSSTGARQRSGARFQTSDTSSP